MDEHKHHSHNSAEKCSCGHEHEHTDECLHVHTHEELYGETSEIPVVFSRSLKFKLKQEASEEKLKEQLLDWIECLKNWVSANKYYIGHIKVFAESEEGFKIHLSTTGKNINVREYNSGQHIKSGLFTLDITAIILGANEKSLTEEILNSLSDKFSTIYIKH
jgi:hypothetical protein